MAAASHEDSTIPDQGSSLSWTSFVQSTTLHGVRYISGGFRVRRWVQTLGGIQQFCSSSKVWLVCLNSNCQNKSVLPKALETLSKNHINSSNGNYILLNFSSFFQMRHFLNQTQTLFCLNFRFLWCGAVLLSLLFFFGQVGNRIAVYFQYKTSVNVKVTYPPELDFPTVIICNQNSFR